MTIDKREETKISGDAGNVELKGVEGVKLDKELEQEEDVSGTEKE